MGSSCVAPISERHPGRILRTWGGKGCGILCRAQCNTRNIQYMTVQYKGGTKHDQYTFPYFNTILGRAIQDRAPSLTHCRPVREGLYCSAPCTYHSGRLAHFVYIGCAHVSTQERGVSHDGLGLLVSTTFP